MKKTNHRTAIATLVLLGIFLSPGLVLAEENVFQITEVTTIQAPDQSAFRLLAKPEIRLPDTTLIVDKATLSILVSPQTSDSTLISIRLFPITSNWNSANVGWDSPWSNPGGDIDDVNYSEYSIIAPGVQQIEMDLTDLCMRWADGRLPYYGFLLGISETSLAGVEFLNGNGNGPFGIITISYTRVLTP